MQTFSHDQFTITIADICGAVGLGRITIWRLLQGQEMIHARKGGKKYFAISDVVARLRQHPKHSPEVETTLMELDKQRRQEYGRKEKME